MDEHRKYLELAIEEAEQAGRDGTYPIGAVLVGPDGKVLSRGRNRVYARNDVTAHAEIDTLQRAGHLLVDDSLKNKCTLYTTVEPCLMCTGALLMAHIVRVVWAVNDDWAGAIRKLTDGPYRPHRFASLVTLAAPFPDLERRQRELMAAFDNSRGRDGDYWLRTNT